MYCVELISVLPHTFCGRLERLYSYLDKPLCSSYVTFSQAPMYQEFIITARILGIDEEDEIVYEEVEVLL